MTVTAVPVSDAVRCSVARDLAKAFREESHDLEARADETNGDTAREYRERADTLRLVARIINRVNRRG